MSRTYECYIIYGFRGKDLLAAGYTGDMIYDIIDNTTISFADPCGMGDYEDGVIGFKLTSGYIIEHPITCNEKAIISGLKKHFNKITKEPQIYSVVSSY